MRAILTITTILGFSAAIILLVAYMYERRINKQTNEERDTLLDVVKDTTVKSKDILNQASKASADILRGIKDTIISKSEDILGEEELEEYKEELQEISNEVQSDVETKIDELAIL